MDKVLELWSDPLADIANLSYMYHDPVVALQALKVQFGQWPSFAGMERGTPYTRNVHMVTGLVRELMGC